MLVELFDQSGGDPTAVRASIQREVVPPVGVALLGPGRQVRRVAQEPLEPPNAPRELGPDGGEVEPFRSGLRAQPSKRVGVPVGSDDPRPSSCGREGREPDSGSDLKEEGARRYPGERKQEQRVLARRVDLRLPEGAFSFAGTGRFRRRGRTTSSYWFHAY